MVAVMEFLGLVVGPLEDRAVHRAKGPVIFPTVYLDPVASLQVSFHEANSGTGHPAGQGVKVTALSARELAQVPVRRGSFSALANSLLSPNKPINKVEPSDFRYVGGRTDQVLA